MKPVPLETIRQAVMCGEFSRAQFLWEECVAGLTGELSAGSLTAAKLAEVRELVEWSRNLVMCRRAHLQDRINSLHVAGEYELAAPRHTHRLVSARF